MLPSGDRGASRIRRSKNGPRRAVVLALVHVIFALHLAHWYWRGETLSPVEPSESMKTLEAGEVNAGAIFFAAAILATLVFGRFFCGWGCHIIAVQDLCGWLMKKCGVRPKAFRSRLLIFIPLILAVYMFIWPTLKRVAVAPVLERWWPTVRSDLGVVEFPDRGFTNHLMTEGFWDTFGSPLMAIPFLLVCGFAAVYFLGAKGFCTYGCPYGGLFGPADLVSPGKIIVDQDRCHQCGHCTAVCTSNVRVHDEVREYGMVVDPGCMKCLDCVSVCPNVALSFGFAKPALLKGRPRNSRPHRVLDTSLGEDLALGAVFAATFFAWRGAYNQVAMLFAVGIAGCATFIAWKAWRIVRERDVRFSIWQLKRGGNLRPAGAMFLLLSLALAALTAQTGFVNFHRWRADSAYEALAIEKARVLLPGQPEISDRARAEARAALEHYRLASGWRDGGAGLVTPPASDLRAALLMLVTADVASAERLMRRVIERSGAGDELVVDLGRVMVLQGRAEEAAAMYERQLSSNPAFWSVREQWALWMLQHGDGARAIAEAESALTRLPPERFTRTAHARTRLTLSRLYGALGRGEESLAQVVEGARVRPNDPVMHENVAAVVYRVRGDVAMAAAAMARAFELDPSSTLRLLQLAQLELESGKTAEAISHFEEAARREPTGSPRREEVARVLESAGHKDAAERVRSLR
ncbi:MAG: 4Fe-4S binding protein [Phycisphaerae bacterium]|nr:4Fe-4S binding protein [Phycisphaerae bacterium]